MKIESVIRWTTALVVLVPLVASRPASADQRLVCNLGAAACRQLDRRAADGDDTQVRATGNAAVDRARNRRALVSSQRARADRTARQNQTSGRCDNGVVMRGENTRAVRTC